MDFTKDMMFHIKYEQDKDILMLNKKKKNGFQGVIQRHKFVVGMFFIGIILIGVDAILINNFVNLLRQL